MTAKMFSLALKTARVSTLTLLFVMVALVIFVQIQTEWLSSMQLP